MTRRAWRKWWQQFALGNSVEPSANRNSVTPLSYRVRLKLDVRFSLSDGGSSRRYDIRSATSPS
jgi:hypothetical protein